MGIGRLLIVGFFAGLLAPLLIVVALARAAWDELRSRYLVW